MQPKDKKINSRFIRAFEFVLKHEGGLVDDPEDPGGLTKYGISRKSFPDLDIRKLTKGDAKNVYWSQYWQKLRGDDLEYTLGVCLFDTAVNCGRGRSVMWMQETINSLGDSVGPLLVVDGLLGPKTLDAAQRRHPCRVAMGIITRRMEHYNSLRNRYARFYEGWMIRVESLTNECLT